MIHDRYKAHARPHGLVGNDNLMAALPICGRFATAYEGRFRNIPDSGDSLIAGDMTAPQHCHNHHPKKNYNKNCTTSGGGGDVGSPSTRSSVAALTLPLLPGSLCVSPSLLLPPRRPENIMLTSDGYIKLTDFGFVPTRASR